MAAPTSSARRTIWLLYWIPWLYFSLAVGFCFAGATWMMPLYVAAWTVLGIPLMLVLGLWAIVLLVRSLTAMGTSNRLPRLVKWLAPAILFISVGLAAWAVLPGFVDGIRTISSPSVTIISSSPPYTPSPLSLFAEMACSWGWRFDLFQLAMFAVSAAATVVAGWLIWRLLHRTESERASRAQVATNLIVICAMLPVLTFGGYELARSLGMKAFLLAYQQHFEGLAKSGHLNNSVPPIFFDSADKLRSLGPIDGVSIESQGAVFFLKGDCGFTVTWPYRDSRLLVWRRQPPEFQHPAVGDKSEGFMSVTGRPLWNDWREEGPSLMFRLPPGQDLWDMTGQVGSEIRPTPYLDPKTFQFCPN